MNRDEIMIMQPGRVFDDLLAERVMNFKIDRFTAHYDGATQECRIWIEAPGRTHNPKPYSTDIAAAWEVVEKMRTAHKSYITIIDNPHLNYDVRFSGNKSSEYERLSSLPHAICRAALLSLIQEDTP